MLKEVAGVTVAAALLTAGIVTAAEPDRTVIVTSSNTADNHLRVYDTAGALIQEVPTFGQGGASGNAGGIATSNGIVALANFGSQTVSLFSRGEGGFELRQTIRASSQPVSVAFGKTHLYVLATTTVESHRIGPDGVEVAADGTAGLLIGDGSAAQVGVAGDALILTEKAGASRAVIGQRLRLLQAGERGRLVFGVVLLLVGVSVATGVDKSIESALLARLPGWWVEVLAGA